MLSLSVGKKLAVRFCSQTHLYSVRDLSGDYVNWYKLWEKIFYHVRPVRLVNSSYSKQTVTWVRESSKPFAMLLEAPIVSPDWVIEKCIWTKNDEVIDGNCPLLCFEVADVTPHGIYKCYWGNSVHPQAVLKLHIESPIDRFVSVLSERYKSCVAAVKMHGLRSVKLHT